MAPDDKMAEVLRKTVHEAKEMISKKRVDHDDVMTLAQVQEAIQILKGAVMIVYPMGLPPHDPIKAELENNEDLGGTQASLEVLELSNTSIWWAGKEMMRGKTLGDFIGRNEKTKVVCKLQKKGQGAPAREPVVSEREQKEMMAYYYRKQEDFKKLSEESSESHLDSAWADNQSLKRQFQGLNNIHFKPGKPL